MLQVVCRLSSYNEFSMFNHKYLIIELGLRMWEGFCVCKQEGRVACFMLQL